MGKHYTDSIKRIVKKLHQENTPIGKISEITDIPKRSIYWIIKSFKENNESLKKENRRRKPKLNKYEERRFISSINKSSKKSLREFSKDYKLDNGKYICKSTVSNAFKKHNINSYVPRKCPFLSKKNVTARYQFGSNF